MFRPIDEVNLIVNTQDDVLTLSSARQKNVPVFLCPNLPLRGQINGHTGPKHDTSDVAACQPTRRTHDITETPSPVVMCGGR